MPIAPVYAASKVHSAALITYAQNKERDWMNGTKRDMGIAGIENASFVADVLFCPRQAGLVHFTSSIAPKMAGLGVRICALCPQPVDTPMVSTMMSMGLPLPETGASLLTPARAGPLFGIG
jgi:NAD(P)-dependent dehydrogenase (short-subunit alcohol dehydrogenase family)